MLSISVLLEIKKNIPWMEKKSPPQNYLYPDLLLPNQLQVLNPQVFLPPAGVSGRDPGFMEVLNQL